MCINLFMYLCNYGYILVMNTVVVNLLSLMLMSIF